MMLASAINDNINHLLIFFVINVTSAYCLSCSEILQLPEEKLLTLQELMTIRPRDIMQCLAHLGRDPLGRQEAEYIWRSIIQHYDGVANIPNKVLMLLHWVTAAVSPEDIANMTLSDIDVIQNFGLNYNLEEAQLNAIADRVRKDFAGKEPEDLTYYDLTALRQILCAFNRSEIERIHPLVYKESALLIGKLRNCNPDAMMGFATLAMQPSAFGNPETWTHSILKILGSVAEYMPKRLTQRILGIKSTNPQTNST